MSPREAAATIWRAALAAADPAPLLARAVQTDGNELSIGGRRIVLSPAGRILVLGCGKAGASMAQAAESIFGDRITKGFVVVKEGYTGPMRRVRLAEAGHPVPDERGHAGAMKLLEMARAAGGNDLVLFLISGGGSALTPAPAPPVTLEEKQRVTRLLLGAGATIFELNAVRKHLSFLKGGQLARAATPAMVVTLALSDVIGDPIDVIGSGPTAPDPTTFAEALAVLDRREVRPQVPRSVEARLTAGARGDIGETPKPGDPVFERVTNVVLGNNALVTDAALATAKRLGFRPHFLTRELQGEARNVGQMLLAGAQRLEPPACLVAGGETTVTVRGQGRGGRCQELALAAAITMAGRKGLTVLAAGTDGTDGPTDAAGAIVDGGTVSRGEAAGLDAGTSLADNDSYHFLRAAGDLVVSGPTNTNLLDLYVVLRS